MCSLIIFAGVFLRDSAIINSATQSDREKKRRKQSSRHTPSYGQFDIPHSCAICDIFIAQCKTYHLQVKSHPDAFSVSLLTPITIQYSVFNTHYTRIWSSYSCDARRLEGKLDGGSSPERKVTQRPPVRSDFSGH